MKMSNEKKVHQGVLQYFGVTCRHSTNLLRVNPTRAVAKEQEYAIFLFFIFLLHCTVIFQPFNFLSIGVFSFRQFFNTVNRTDLLVLNNKTGLLFLEFS